MHIPVHLHTITDLGTDLGMCSYHNRLNKVPAQNKQRYMRSGLGKGQEMLGVTIPGGSGGKLPLLYQKAIKRTKTPHEPQKVSKPHTKTD